MQELVGLHQSKPPEEPQDASGSGGQHQFLAPLHQYKDLWERKKSIVHPSKHINIAHSQASQLNHRLAQLNVVLNLSCDPHRRKTIEKLNILA